MRICQNDSLPNDSLTKCVFAKMILYQNAHLLKWFFSKGIYKSAPCKMYLWHLSIKMKNYTGWSKKKFMMWSRGNSKIFFDGVFLSIYIHLLKKLELSCQPIKKETYFFVLFWVYIKTKWLIKNLHFMSNELIKYFTK